MDRLQNSNKRIAKNTLIVYIELFTTIIINLVISRLVLQALGASDFGLYNVVGGVIAMFTFISNSMTTTTIRFLNFEMGKPVGDVCKIFNQSNVLHISFAIIILFLLETIGSFYIINYLNVDPGKESDAMFVFQVSTVIACVGVISVPYKSVFIAHEHFTAVAIIDVVSVLAKLLVVIMLLYYNGNVLRVYAFGMSLVTFFSIIIYYVLCKKNWPQIVRWKFVRNWRSYKEQLFYSNWNLLATASMVGRNQGSAIIINLFFGTIVNAAYAISMQVFQQVNHFVGKFDAAVAPQITQNLGSGNFDRSTYLASHTCRASILMMIVIFFPLYLELDYILHLWLGDNIPEGTLLFCQYTLLIAIVSSTGGGLMQLINGVSKIKWFKIQSFCWNVLPLFIACYAFTLGSAPYIIVLLFVFADIFNRATQLYLLHRLYSFDVKGFIKQAFMRPVLVFGIMIVYSWMYYKLTLDSHFYHILGIVITIIIASALVFFGGLTVNERSKIADIVVSRVKWLR